MLVMVVADVRYEGQNVGLAQGACETLPCGQMSGVALNRDRD
jgi:hypothetical protein